MSILDILLNEQLKKILQNGRGLFDSIFLLGKTLHY